MPKKSKSTAGSSGIACSPTGETPASGPAERTLQESLGELMAVYASVPVAILVIDPERRVRRVNAVAARLAGRTEEEMIGMLPGESLRCLHHLDDPAGCGAGPDCTDCLVRSAVLDTLATGASHPQTEVHFPQIDGHGTQETWLGVSTSPVTLDGRRHALVCVQDISVQMRRRREQEAVLTILRLANVPNRLHELIKAITVFLQDWSGCEAVGVRLRDGADFPYFETRGFPPEFVEAENRLCAVDAAGGPLCDERGNPVLECMCGNILCGRFDPSKPFFTTGGSFWSNGTTELLATTTAADRQARTRNRCNGEGYESVALIPLRTGQTTFGLLQFNDRRKNRFSPALIEVLERLGNNIAIALAERKAEEALRESEALLRESQRIAGLGSYVVDDVAVGAWRSSDVLDEIFGIDQAYERSLEGWANLIHPDDRDMMAEYFRNEVCGQGSRFDKEYRILRHSDGAERWVHGLGELVFDAQGRPRSMHGTIRDVTNRKRAQGALRESEGRYRSLVDNIGLGVVLIGPDYRIRSANPAQARLFGKAPEDLVGTECFREFEKRDAVCPQCPGQVAMETGRPADIDRQAIHADGQLHTVRVQAFPVLDSAGRVTGFIEVTEDITERRLAEGRLADARKYIATLFDVSPIALITYKESGQTMSANREAARLVGTSVENLLRQNFRELASWKESGMLALADKALATGQPQSGEVHTVSTYGREMWMACRFVPFPFDDQQHVLLAGTDVSERRRAEERYRQVQKMEAIGQLAGGVAHDFRNQLTVIKGYGEMLLRRSLTDGEGRAMIREILKAVERSTATTGQLLAFSRQETLRPKVQSLRDCVADIGSILPHLIGEDIRLMILSNHDACTANVDGHLFQQAILNLAANARDAMPKGGTLTIETGYKDLGGQACRIDPELAEGEYVVVTVSDTGSGMDEATRTRVFDPFFTTKDVGKGTGLGLAMVHGFAKQSGGTVDIQSQPGRGTTVRLYFPRAAAAPAEGPAVRGPGASRNGGEIVLLVEDEPDVRAVAARLLRDAGYRVRQATGAEEARAMFEPAEGPADVLVTDIVMPGSSGVALAQEFRARRPGLGVLFISGYPGEELSKRGLDEATEILTKPFAGKALLEKVRQVLEESRAPSAQLAQRPPDAVDQKRPE
ncbi:MAG: PAS domain S-box protein [Planctomycetota bacterium]|nr:PAS domain S-box protein [Planctomycetota bacterium]